MSIENLKFKSLIKKVTFLRADLEFHHAEHQRRRQIFYDDLQEWMENSEYLFSEEKTKKNMVDVYKRTEASNMSQLNEELKAMFKKIAKVAHPDIAKTVEHEINFKKARAALDNHDWFGMYEAASELDIGTTNISDTHIAWLTQEIKQTEAIIKGITTTFEWIYSNDGANKDQLLTTYCMITCKKKE